MSENKRTLLPAGKAASPTRKEMWEEGCSGWGAWQEQDSLTDTVFRFWLLLVLSASQSQSSLSDSELEAGCQQG